MDANVKIVLDDYFEGAAELKPNLFVHIRDNRVIDPLVTALFSESGASMLVISDDQEIFEGDILVYPKTRQFCHVDDIRHFADKKVYNVYYHTRGQRESESIFGDD